MKLYKIKVGKNNYIPEGIMIALKDNTNNQFFGLYNNPPSVYWIQTDGSIPVEILEEFDTDDIIIKGDNHEK